MGGTCCKFNGATGPLGRQKILAAKPTHHSKKKLVYVQEINLVRFGQGKRDSHGAEVFGGMGGKGHM